MTDSGAGPGDLDEAIDALYADGPDGFVAARQRLTAELRRAGRKDEAKQVAALRRPTMAAWALDQFALRSPGAIDTLVAAGDRLPGAPRSAGRATRGRTTLRLTEH